MDDREKFNALTHIVGAVLALVGAVVLIVRAAQHGDAWAVTGVAVYGVALVLLFSVSALYHALHGRTKHVLRRLDHHSIYLLIAGSYTPFCLVTLRGPWGWTLLGIVWALAIIGSAHELKPREGLRVLPMTIYIVMGWIALAAAVPLWRALGPTGFAWLVAGGLIYTFGLIFYALERRLRHAHAVWHVFVMAGSAAHYGVILNYVV